MFKLVRGIYCTLRRPNIDDLKTMIGWMDDPYLNDTVFDGDTFGGSAKKQARNWIQANTTLYGSETLVLMVDTVKDPQTIGMVIFSNIDWRSRTAEIRYLIGHADHRNGLYGSEMSLLTLQLAFDTLNLHKIYGNVSDDNIESLSLVNFGAKIEGKLASYIRFDDESYDYWLYAMFSDDYRKFIEKNKTGVLRRHFQAGLLM